MTSQIDPTKPEVQRATTESVRDNFQFAKDEIEALQAYDAAQDINIGQNATDISDIQAEQITQNDRLDTLEAAPPATGADLIGAVQAFAFDKNVAEWLYCNGQAVNRTTYADLFAAIGTIYGVGDGSTTFNLPDYRGEFLRGQDDGAGNDPDAAGRVGGDAVGSSQGDAFEAHNHGSIGDHNHSHVNLAGSGSTYLNTVAGGSTLTMSNAESTGNAGAHTHATNGTSAETRPRNIYARYYIHI